MPTHSRLLLLGGILTGVASLLHVGIIVGGADWYRFFGAGSEMARMAERGSPYPALVTGAIAIMLSVAMLYAFSGARVLPSLPFLRIVLIAVAAVYLVRGAAGMPLVFLVDDPYMHELRARPLFMAISSAICLLLGGCYAAGAIGLSRTLR